MPQARKSVRRFKRPETPKSYDLMPDDVTLIWHIFRHRLIDSQSLYSLFPNRSPQVLSRRLNRLWQNEYLDRPVAQNIKSTVKPGSQYLVYALGREGARYLRDQQAPVSDPQRWSAKNKTLKPQTVQHHLSKTRFMVRMVADVEKRRNASITYPDELLRNTPVAKRKNAGLTNTLRTHVDWYGRSSLQGTAPDFVFRVTIDDEQQFIFLEIDEGTETVEPDMQKIRSERFWDETSVLRKMAIYSSAFRTGAHTKQFLFPSFRVLTVTTSPERVKTMQEAYRNHLTDGALKTPPGLFLFTDWQTLAKYEGSLLSLPLQNGVGRGVILSPVKAQ